MSRKLLLADDSVTIQRVIEMTFAGEDVQVLTVGDGEEAIARIAAEKPDIILADIGMPKRSGYEVSAFVKGHPEFSTIPVLLLAGAFEPVDDAKAKEAKCDGVLVKPFEPQQVIARVRELIGGAKGSPTQSAVSDIPRPAAALAPPRPVEIPTREERPVVPDDLMDFNEDDLIPRFADVDPEPEAEPQREPAAPQPIILDDSLDDYFDKLDEAFAGIHSPSSGQMPSADLTFPDAPSSHADARGARPDRPVLERDLESFDDTMLADLPLPRSAPSDDPFGGLDSIQPENLAIPTLDELLAEMPPAPESAAITFDAAPEPMTFEPLPAIDLPSAPPPLEPPDMTATLSPATSFVSSPSPVTPPVSHVAPPAEAHSGRSIIADAFSALLAVEQGEPGAAPVRLPGNGSSPVVTEAMVDDVAKRVISRLALGSSDQMQAIVRDIVSGVAERLVREEIDRIRRNAPGS